MSVTNAASMTIAEMREFASFTPGEQRYIKRSLDIGLGREDAFVLWGRDVEERSSIRRQYLMYQELKCLRAVLPDGNSFNGIDDFIGSLARIAAFDLAQGKIECFGAFRFLYERILGAQIRPWLPAAFCAASAMPMLPPERRKILLQSLSEAAATAPGWSDRQPCFFPEYVDEAA